MDHPAAALPVTRGFRHPASTAMPRWRASVLTSENAKKRILPFASDASGVSEWRAFTGEDDVAISRLFDAPWGQEAFAESFLGHGRVYCGAARGPRTPDPRITNANRTKITVAHRRSFVAESMLHNQLILLHNWTPPHYGPLQPASLLNILQHIHSAAPVLPRGPSHAQAPD